MYSTCVSSKLCEFIYKILNKLLATSPLNLTKQLQQKGKGHKNATMEFTKTNTQNTTEKNNLPAQKIFNQYIDIIVNCRM